MLALVLWMFTVTDDIGRSTSTSYFAGAVSAERAACKWENEFIYRLVSEWCLPRSLGLRVGLLSSVY